MSPDDSKADLMIQLIDEVMRGRSRMQGVHEFHDRPELNGLAGTVLTAVVLAAHPPTVPQIGRSLGYPRQTIQRHAELLAGLGLVRFVENPDHKRAHRLSATPQGREAHRRADTRSRCWAAQVVADVPADKLAVTVETLRVIRHHLEAEIRQARPRAKSGA